MTDNSTNYVYLNTGSSCVPAVKAGTFTVSDLPIAVVVAASGAITSITDDRTLFRFNSSVGTVTTSGSPVAGDLSAFSAPTVITTATGHNVAKPLGCADSSGSGTAQACNTSPTFTPVAGDCVVYTTTTANTGTGLTLNVNSLGAKSVAKWQATTTLAANDVLANKQVLTCYDGTNWELHDIGNAPSSGGSVSLICSGTVTLNPGATASSACSSAATATCTGLATTDNIMIDFNADPTATTGYIPSAMGTIVKYPTSNTVNVKFCNNTGSSITPTSITLNYRVVR
jgi:hypothetical protein